MQLFHCVLDMRERGLPVDHLIQNAPETPNVTGATDAITLRTGPPLITVIVLHLGRIIPVFPLIIVLTIVLCHKSFRGHAVWSSNLCFAESFGCVVRLNCFSDPEVDELECTRDVHEIRRLQVAVYDLVMVHGVNRFKHLFPVGAAKIWIQRLILRLLE